ncbi:MAG: beta-lactamase family protein [Kangiellaceae bacterium]|nr:beta-lactamase family protein [Kangiellaceae bacterium]
MSNQTKPKNKFVSLTVFINLLTLQVFLFSSSASSNEQSEREDAIRQVLAPYVDNQVFSGSILIAKDGAIIFNQGFGNADYQWNISNTGSTKFGIGSISKTITSVLVMKLVEQGTLKLSDKLSKYLVNYPKSIGDQISIHHLLSHRSGLPNYFAIPGWTTGEFNKSISNEKFEKVLSQLPLSSPPGTKYQYSNTGFFFLARIVEIATGESFQQNLNKHVLSRAEMKHSGLHENEVIISEMATGYQLKQEGGYRASRINRHLFRAAGDFYSTTKDLFHFEQALYDETLLNKQSREHLFSSENLYGWNRNTIKLGKVKKEIVSYSGQLLGFNSMITRFTESKSSIIIAGNNGTSYFQRMQLTQELAHILFEQPAEHNVRVSMLLHKALYENELPQLISQVLRQPSNFVLDISGIKALAQQVNWAGLKNEFNQLEQLIKSLES